MTFIANKISVKICITAAALAAAVICSACSLAQVQDGGGSQAESARTQTVNLQDTQSGEKNLQDTQPGEKNWQEMQPSAEMIRKYADQFSVSYYGDDYRLLTIRDTGRYLVVSEGREIPDDLDDDIAVIQLPIENCYLAASSAMDFWRELGALDKVTMTSTKETDWYIEEIAEKIRSGQIYYVGKYSAPDYEAILENKCDLAIESTMIYHSPEIKEKLESLDIPVLVEHSSYESHPLGRLEWIRVYGILSGREEAAEEYFESRLSELENVLSGREQSKTAAFFYITSNGSVNVRKSGDYVSKMIEIAGGKYLPETGDGAENALSTMNMQMEEFYAQCRDVDILIYNSTIDDELRTVEELLRKSSLLADFKAVQNGNVWCTGKNMFQEPTQIGDIILDLETVISGTGGEDDKLRFLHRLR